MAEDLLDAADLWLWCTTAGKYADERSMSYVARAAQRGAAMALVLTQVHAGDEEPVLADLRRKVAAAGAADVEVIAVPWAAVDDGLLPEALAAPLRGWLRERADPDRRVAIREQTLRGALRALPADLERLMAEVGGELREAQGLRNDMERVYERAEEQFAAAVAEGLPLRREVLHRWERFVGGSRLLQLTDAAAGQARQWVRGLLRGLGGEEERAQRAVRVEVATTVSETMVKVAQVAAAEVAVVWDEEPAGRVLLAATGTLPAPGVDERAEEQVRAWQEHVAELVATAGARRRTQARIVSSTISLTATGAILGALASAGITGAEAGLAAAAGAANQGLLTKVLGEANVRRLVIEARRDLLQRFAATLDLDRSRLRAALDAASASDEALSAVTTARRSLLLAT